jgi:hypothetical protein
MTLLDVIKQLLGDKINDDVTLNDDASKDGKKPEDEGAGTGGTGAGGTGAGGTGADDKGTDGGTGGTDDGVDKKEEDIKEKGGNAVNFGEGWFNVETGEIDLSKVEGEIPEDVLAQFTSISESIKAGNTGKLKDAAFAETIKEYPLAVSEGIVKKMIDFDKVTIGDDNKVEGIKDQLEELKKNEPGLFKSENDGKKGSPLDEGFNPTETKKKSTNMTSTEALLSRINKQ